MTDQHTIDQHTTRTATDQHTSDQHTTRTATPVPLVVFLASLLVTGGGQWLNRHVLKAIAAPSAIWLVSRHGGAAAPLLVGAVAVALAVEAAVVAHRRAPDGPVPTRRPLVAAVAAVAPALPAVLAGAGQWGLVVGAGQLYNGHTLRAVLFGAAWWASLYWWAASLGYAVYLIPAAATAEAFVVSFTGLDRYGPTS